MNAKFKKNFKTGLRLAGAVALTILFLFPIYWLFMISFKTADEIYAYPPVWWPESLQFSNYAVLFKDGDAATVGNSLIVAGTSTVFAMLLGTTCAYSIVRFKTGGNHLANWIISQRMIPPIAIVFPVFILYVWFGRHLFWINTALYSVQPALCHLDDARLHTRHPHITRTRRPCRRIHKMASTLESYFSDVSCRVVCDSYLYVCLCVERFYFRPCTHQN